MRSRLPLAFVVVLSLLGCLKEVPRAQVAPASSAAPTTPPAPLAEAAPASVPDIPGLLMRVEPPDAELAIDGAPQGKVSELKTQSGVLPLKSGIYRVSLTRAGYVSWRAEVTINDTPEALQVRLLKQ